MVRGGTGDPYYGENDGGDYYEDNNPYYYEEDDNYYQQHQQDGYNDYYEEAEENEPEYRGRSARTSSRSSKASSIFSNLSVPQNLQNYSNRKIGLPLLAGGFFLVVLGVVTFFNKFLISFGHMLLIGGVPLTIGSGRTVSYVLQPKKARSTGCFLLGLLLVLTGHPILGMALEAFGFLNLFGNMFPLLLAMLRTLPGVGSIIPDSTGTRRSKSRERSRRREDYDDRENIEQYY